MEASSTPLSARDYRKFRWALVLPFTGALSSPFLAGLLGAVPLPDRVQAAIGSLLAFVLMIWGLLLLRSVFDDGRYRRFVEASLACSVVSAIVKGFSRMLPPPWSLHAADLVSSVALLFFVLALQRLVRQTDWAEGLRPRVRRSVFLVALFWVGVAAIVIPLSRFNPTAEATFEKSGSYFLLLVLPLVPAIQLYRVLRDLYRDAGLRNNLLVIRGRRRKPVKL